MNMAIQTEGLTKIFGKQMAVNNLNMEVKIGSVYGFLGPNGAGKTTTIKMLLGLIRSSCGTSSLLGCNSTKLFPQLKQKIGYVAEDQRMYLWMRVSEIIKYTAPLYPTWDKNYCNELITKLELPMDKKIGELSKGMKIKLALLLAISYKPNLLILDDPSSRLDPVARHEILENIISIIDEGNRTVFFSSHLLDEVERVADDIGIIDRGKLKISMPLQALKSSVKKVRMIFDNQIPEILDIKGILSRKRQGRELSITIENFDDGILEKLKKYCTKTEVIDLSLQDIFIEYVHKLKREDKGL